MAKKELSERQKSIVGYIAEYVGDHGRPPTIREIGSACDISSTSVVNYNLTRLVERGLIDRVSEVSRGLRLTDAGRKMFGIVETTMIRVPMLGMIKAGVTHGYGDDGAYDESDAIAVASESINGDTEDLYALRVNGWSMVDALVGDGDTVILRKQTEAKDGDMVAARVISSDEVTLKYYYYESAHKRVRLQPANPTMDPIYVQENDIEIQGRVVKVVRDLS